MKIDFLGNFYLQPFLTAQELNYLNAFCSSIHFDNNGSPLLGLYNISISNEDLLNKCFHFNQQINIDRSSFINTNSSQPSVLFPFLNSPIHFTEKAIKFSFIDIKNTADFIYFIEYISTSILFYYQHFFKQNSYCHILNKDFFNFFQLHNFSGNIYFKLADFGHIYRLTGCNDKITLFKGKYNLQTKGKDYLISSDISYDKVTQRQLNSLYSKISIIDIKNNALFDEEGTIFSFMISEELQKMLQFYSLDSKLISLPTHKPYINKIHKI